MELSVVKPRQIPVPSDEGYRLMRSVAYNICAKIRSVSEKESVAEMLQSTRAFLELQGINSLVRWNLSIEQPGNAKRLSSQTPTKITYVLDYGCGSGEWGLTYVNGNTNNLLQVDLEDHRRDKNTKFMTADEFWEWACPGGVPSPTVSFSQICLCQVLHHIERSSVTNCLGLFKDLLEPLGQLIIREHDVSNDKTSEICEWQHFCYEYLEDHNVPLGHWNSEYQSGASYWSKLDLDYWFYQHNGLCVQNYPTNNPTKVYTAMYMFWLPCDPLLPWLGSSEELTFVQYLINHLDAINNQFLKFDLVYEAELCVNNDAFERYCLDLVNISFHRKAVALLNKQGKKLKMPDYIKSVDYPSVATTKKKNPIPEPKTVEPQVLSYKGAVCSLEKKPKITEIDVKNGSNATSGSSPVTSSGEVALKEDSKNLAEWLKKQVVYINDDTNVINYFEKKTCFKPQVNPNKAVGNTHPITAAYREYAVLAFLNALPKKTKTVILDVFGSNRNRRTFQHALLEWVVCPDEPIEGDAARGFDRVPYRQGDVFLLQDVYQEGEAGQTITPEYLLRLLELTNLQVGYLIMRKFEGQAGIDSVLYDEGAWVRDEEGNIIFSSDPATAPYHPHPSPDWLFQYRAYKGLDISPMKTFGPFHLLCVKRTKAHATPLFSPVKNVGPLEYLDINVPNSVTNALHYFNFWCPNMLYSTRKMLVSKNLVTELSMTTRNKVYTGLLYDSVAQIVTQRFSQNQLLFTLSTRFPEFYEKVLENTILAVLYYKREEHQTMYSYLVNRFYSSDNNLVLTRQRKLVDSGSKTNWLIAIGGAGILAFMLYTKRKYVGALGLTTFDVAKTLCSRTCSEITNVWSKQVSELKDATQSAITHLVDIPVERAMTQVTPDMLPSGTNVETFKTHVWSAYLYIMFLAPVFEEFLREYFPKLSVLYNHGYESFEKWMTAGWTGLVNNLLFHSAMFMFKKAGISLTARSIMHAAWNCNSVINHTVFQPAAGLSPVVIGVISSLMFAQWKEARRAKQDFDISEGLHSLPEGEAFDSTMSAPFDDVELLDSVEETLKIRLNGKLVSLERLEEFSLDLHEPAKDTIFPILIPSNLMHRPDKGLVNLIAALKTRIWIDPQNRPASIDTFSAWESIKSHVLPRYNGSLVEKTFAESVANMPGPKRKRLENAYKLRVECGKDKVYSKSASVKHDELIALKDGNLKPRAIVQFDPGYLVDTTVESHMFSDYLHAIYNEHNLHVVDGIPTLFVYASGYTPAQLDQVMEIILSSPHICVHMVAGDDSYSSWGPLASVYGLYEETDFSKYDSTEGEECHIFDLEKYRALGFPAQFGRIKDWGVSAPTTVHLRTKEYHVKMSFDSGYQQATGHPTTTCGNSDHNIDFRTYCILERANNKNTTQLALEMGFLLKSRTYDNPYYGTFLKGWWVPTLGGPAHWLPLPSAFLKIGKLLKDPRLIAKNSDWQTAYGLCAYALASSYGSVPYEYPILGPVLKKMQFLGIPSDLILEHNRFKRMKVSPFVEELDLIMLYNMLEYRYGISQDEIIDFHLYVEAIERFPSCDQSSCLFKIDVRLFLNPLNCFLITMGLRRAAEAEKKIRDACDKYGISRAGYHWLDHALDPFKDLVKENGGYPDKIMDPSVVQVVKQTAVITSPAGAGVDWDAVIYMDGALQPSNVRATAVTAGVGVAFLQGTQGVTDYVRGGCCWRTAASGTPLDMTQCRAGLGVDSTLYNGATARVIAMGMEIHDTTAKLDKQGSLICWRVDKPMTSSFTRSLVVDDGVTACISTSPSFYNPPNPPQTAAEALDLLGSVQWETQKGAYVVPVLVEDPTPMDRAFEYPYYGEGTGYITQLSSTGAAKIIKPSNVGVPRNPWSCSGVYVTGMKDTGELTVNFNYLIEVFPDKTNNLRRLAFPSPPDDPICRELYAKVARELPMGVTVDQNAMGAWIAGIGSLMQGAVKGIRWINDKVKQSQEIKKEVEKTVAMSKELLTSSTSTTNVKPTTLALVSTNGNGGGNASPKNLQMVSVQPVKMSRVGNGNYVPIKKAQRPDRMRLTKGTNPWGSVQMNPRSSNKK